MYAIITNNIDYIKNITRFNSTTDFTYTYPRPAYIGNINLKLFLFRRRKCCLNI